MASTIGLMSTDHFRNGLRIIIEWVYSLWSSLPELVQMVLMLWFVFFVWFPAVKNALLR